MINAILVALASELSFVIGFLVGSFLSVLVGVVMARVINSSHLSTARALVQGTIIGLVAGTSCIGVALLLGHQLSVPNSWLLWLALVLPVLGQLGVFPLSRLSKVAWVPMLRFAFAHNAATLAEAGINTDTESVRTETLHKTDWFIRRAFWGVVVGVVISAWWLVS